MPLFLIQYEIPVDKSFSVKDEMLVPGKTAKEAESTFRTFMKPGIGRALIVPQGKGPRMLVPLDVEPKITGCAKSATS